MKELKDIEFQENVPIKNLTTYKTQGNLKFVIYPKSVEDWIRTIEFLNYFNIPYFIIGNGSNLLINPETQKFAISTKKIKKTIKIKENIITASSSCLLSQIFKEAKDNSLSGFEQLATIPASLGGAIKNNASCFDKAIFDTLQSIKVIQDKKVKHLKKSDICYSYHKTDLQKEVILSAKFKLREENKEIIQKNFIDYVENRKIIQPVGLSCGSVFRNPRNTSAGLLIEQCGLKNKQRGGAIISQKHSNFIINKNNASFEDVLYLIEFCEEEVYNKFNIKLEREVEIIT